ncbi:hypothetical protein FBZ83_118118 [Azospirillum brasilense]|uniref:Uncharacterized protein n=1 Tax=Azospirillum brasilense TaxID=192 RepID=A0A560BVP6_AZOBR|nr:hypothetical protein [Azospirillum brasilense]MBK3734980.1 hypothetical protein [Azospirillum brasilense]TWA76579.1 hypothetical protein FBZ83_118118 [Azospirillum brasilense]
MTSIRLNGAFRDAVADITLAVAQDPNLVALVMRWNEDDALLWTLRSLPNGQNTVPGGGAAHAEEALIVNWAGYVAQNNGQEPNIVEILLTKSPCLDRSPERQMLGEDWTRGCSSKLRQFILDKPANDWRICFLAYYQEDIRIEAQAYGAVAEFAGIPQADVYLWADRHKG